MQTLYVNVRRQDGTEELREVRILASWTGKDGELYLHADGVYGSKDGTPVASDAVLRKFIQSPAQLRLALSWWENQGCAQAKEAEGARQEQEEALAALGVAAVVQPGAELDAITYRRRKLGKGGAVSGPMTWTAAGFSSRPDWWGVAALIVIREFQYEITSVASAPEKLPEEAGMGQNSPDDPEGGLE